MRLGREALVRHATYERLRSLQWLMGDVGGKRTALLDAYVQMHQSSTWPTTSRTWSETAHGAAKIAPGKAAP